jgi:serine/threonine-protein kinase RsbW
VNELAAAHRLPADPVADMLVALDEVLTNIITHGYSDDAAHEIRIRLTVGADALEAEVEDDGRPFNPLTAAPPDLSGSLQERRVGGLGIHFARKLMSEVAYSLVDNKNRLVLKKCLTARREEDSRGLA